MSLEDYIITEPDPIMIVENKKQLKVYNDPKLVLLLDLLRKGPMTIREIADEYNKRIENPKSEITIYNYLKSLQDAGLVIIAGQRLVHGSTAATQLYSRKAHLMITMTLMTDKYWETEESQELLEAARIIMYYYTGIKLAEITNLKALLKNLYSIPSARIKDFVNNYSDSLKYIFTNSTQEEVSETINLFSLAMILLESEKFEKELKNCFP